MSRRNKPYEKKLRRLERALTKSPEPLIDLVDYLQTRRFAQTAGQARKMILAAKVTDGTSVLGIGKEQRWVPDLVGGIKSEEFDVVHQLVPKSAIGENGIIVDTTPDEMA